MSVSTTDVLPLFRQSTHQTMKPQWPLIFKLVDLVIADTRRGAALLVPHIQKQLKDKDPVCVFLTLCVLEACMKYCGSPFHEFVAHPIFMKEMKSLVKKRYTKRKSALNGKANFKNLIGQKAARLIRQWGVGYHEKKLKYRTFYTTYMQLLRKNIQFPYGEDDSVPEKPDGGNYDKVESKKKTGKKKGKVPLRVKTEVSESREAIKRLREVFKGVTSTQQARNSDIANNIAARLVKKQETMTTLVNEFMGNEVALDLLLNVNGEISGALAFYKKKRGESVEDDASDTSEVSDVDEESVREGEFDALHNSRAKRRQQNNPLSNQQASKGQRKRKPKKSAAGPAAMNPFDMFNTAPTPSTTTGSSLLMDMNPLQPRPITNRVPVANPQQPSLNATPFLPTQPNGNQPPINTQLHHTNVPNVAGHNQQQRPPKNFNFSITHGNVFNTNPTPAQRQQFQQQQQFQQHQQFQQQQFGGQQPFMTSQPFQPQFGSQPVAVPQSQFGNGQMYSQQPQQRPRPPMLAKASNNWSSSPAVPTVGSAPAATKNDLFGDLNPF